MRWRERKGHREVPREAEEEIEDRWSEIERHRKIAKH